MPIDFDKILAPQESEAKDFAQQLKSLNAGQRQLYKSAGEYVEGWLSDDELHDIAIENVNARAPRGNLMTPEIYWNNVKAEYQKMRKNRDAEFAGAQQGIWEAIQSGGGKGYEGYFLTDEQREAIEQNRPWRRTEEQARYELARQLGDQALAPHALMLNWKALPKDAKEKYERLLADDVYGESGKDERGLFGSVLWGLGTLGRAGAGALVGAGENLPQVQPDFRRPKDVGDDRWSVVMGSNPQAEPMPQTGSGSPANVAGIDLPMAARELVDKPEKIADVAKSAAKNAGKAFVGESTDESSMFRQNMELRQRFWEAAKEKAAQEFSAMPPGMREDMQNEYAAKLFEDAISNSNILDPNTAQLFGELGLDASNFLPVGKLLTAPFKGAAKIPAVKRGANALQEAFSFMPEATRLQQAGMDDAASLMRLADAQKSGTLRKYSDLGTNELAAMKRLPKDRREELYALLRKGDEVDVDSLDVPMREALLAGRNLAEKLHEVGSDTGALSRFGSDGKLKIAKREGYVPQAVMTEEGRAAAKARKAEQEALSYGTEGGGQVQHQASAARARKLADDDFVKDPVVQFQAGIDDAARKSASAQEIKDLTKYMEGEGLIKKFKLGKTSQDEVDDVVRALNKEAGDVEWTRLDQRLNDVVQRATGSPGALRGEEAFVVHKDVAERLSNIAPLVSASPKKTMSTLTKAASEFDTEMLRPFQKFWRITHTSLSGPAYTTRNLIGAIGLGQIAHGMRALDPDLQMGAVAGALASAGMGAQKARKLKFRLKSGIELELGKIIDMAHDTGLLDQWELRAGLDMMSKRKFGRALDKTATFATETMSPLGIPLGSRLSTATVNRAVENYQKLVGFMGFLEGTTDLHLAKALDLTSQYMGNYRRLANWEQGALKDIFGFYAWNRFILPHMTRAMVQHPQRFAPWAKARGYFERETPLNVNRSALPAWMRAGATKAPMQYQPPTYGKLENSYKLAMRNIEDPLWMWGSVLSMFDPSTRDRDISELYGPAMKFAVEVTTGRDAATGAEIERVPFMPEDLGQMFTASYWKSLKGRQHQDALTQLLLSPIERPSSRFMDMYQLYFQNDGISPQNVDLALRYRVGRDNMGLADLMDKLFVGEGEAGSLGGFNIYLGNTAKDAYLNDTMAQRAAGATQKKIAREESY